MFIQDAIEIVKNRANKDLEYCLDAQISAQSRALVRSVALRALTLCSSAQSGDDSAVYQVRDLANFLQVKR